MDVPQEYSFFVTYLKNKIVFIFKYTVVSWHKYITVGDKTCSNFKAMVYFGFGQNYWKNMNEGYPSFNNRASSVRYLLINLTYLKRTKMISTAVFYCQFDLLPLGVTEGVGVGG